MGITGDHDTVQRRRVGHRDLQDAHHRPQTGPTNVSAGGLLAMTKGASISLARQTGLDRAQTGAQPVRLPGAPGGIIEAAHTAQVFFYLRRNKGMSVQS